MSEKTETNDICAEIVLNSIYSKGINGIGPVAIKIRESEKNKLEDFLQNDEPYLVIMSDCYLTVYRTDATSSTERDYENEITRNMRKFTIPRHSIAYVNELCK